MRIRSSIRSTGSATGELALVIDCGYQDFFYRVNMNLHEKLMQRGVGHDFLTRPGEHNSAYWSNSLPYQVLFFHRYFQRQTPPELKWKERALAAPLLRFSRPLREASRRRVPSRLSRHLIAACVPSQ